MHSTELLACFFDAFFFRRVWSRDLSWCRSCFCDVTFCARIVFELMSWPPPRAAATSEKATSAVVLANRIVSTMAGIRVFLIIFHSKWSCQCRHA